MIHIRDSKHRLSVVGVDLSWVQEPYCSCITKDHRLVVQGRSVGHWDNGESRTEG